MIIPDIKYMGKSLKDLSREELIQLVVGQDFVIQRICENKEKK